MRLRKKFDAQYHLAELCTYTLYITLFLSVLHKLDALYQSNVRERDALFYFRREFFIQNRTNMLLHS